jgi:hypothetical protein
MTSAANPENPHRCHGCKRQLKHPSTTGYGPVCWRRLRGEMTTRGYTNLDHGPVPISDGQLTFDCEPTWTTPLTAPLLTPVPGLTSRQLRTMTTITLTGDLL